MQESNEIPGVGVDQVRSNDDRHVLNRTLPEIPTDVVAEYTDPLENPPLETENVLSCKRSRTLSVIGRIYQQNEGLKERNSLYSRLKKQLTLVTQCIESSSFDMVNMETSNMDRMFDNVFAANQKYQNLLEDENEKEKEECCAWITKVDQEVFALKTMVCTWLKNQDDSSVKSSCKSKKSSRSGRSEFSFFL